MRRRHLLGLLAAGASGLGGCSGFGEEENPTVTPYEVPTVTRTIPGSAATPERRAPARPEQWDTSDPADVVTFQTGPRTLAAGPLRYEPGKKTVVTLRVAETASADGPALIQALLFNSRGTHWNVPLDRFPPFSTTALQGAYAPPVDAPAETTEHAEGLVLVPAPGHELTEREFTIKRGPQGYWHVDEDISGRVLPEEVEMGSMTGFIGEYWVLGSRGTSGLEPGRYHFGTDESTQKLTLTLWDSDHPGPNRDSRFGDERQPEFDVGQDIQWFHRADGSTSRYLLPDRERLSLPTTLSARLCNRGEQWITGQPSLYKRVEDQWFRVGITRVLGGLHGAGPPIRPDGTVEYAIALAHGPAQVATGPSIGHLGGGRYALVAWTQSVRAQYGMRFDVDAPAVTARPEKQVSVSRNGDTVIVADPELNGPEDIGATAIARRTDGPARQLIPEQVMGLFGATTRNTLPLFERDVETVRYHSTSRLPSTPVAFSDDWTVRFGGVTADLTVSRASNE